MKKKPDPLRKIKQYGYRRAVLASDADFEDFVDFAKFALCRQTHRLWKDPIWDSYSDEEILAEYYSHSFIDNESLRHQFEVDNDKGKEAYGDDYDWILQKTEELAQERAQELAQAPEVVSFSPETGEDRED